MAKAGPARASNVVQIREGNPSKRGRAELDKGVRLPVKAPVEPGWVRWFPTDAAGDEPDWLVAQNEAAREEASGIWARVVSILDAEGVLAEIDEFILADLCVVVVRIGQAERDVSRHGLRQEGERGWTRNGSITSAKQYRDHFRWICGQLGLSPVARDALVSGGPGDDEGGPFD